MPSIRLRGIYSLALSALLQEQGWKIVQPSEELQAYITASPPEPFDLQLYDRDDLQGVIVSGTDRYLQELQRLLTAELPDAILYTAPTSLEAIYVGLVHRRRSCGYEIDLGAVTGFLPNGESDGSLRPGAALPVQVRELTHPGDQAILTKDLSIAGRFAVLVKAGGVGISREIRDTQERERLAQLGKRWASRHLGVIWRTAAQGRAAGELQREIESLQRAFAQLDDHPHDGIPGLLRPGTPTLIVEFPGGSKRALDIWRARFSATEPGYHRRQTMPIPSNEATDFPAVGASVMIEHIRFPNEALPAQPARVSATDPSKRTILVRRELRGTDLGFEIARAPGDYALTEFQEGCWSCETQYFSGAGKLKGAHININTPVEIFPTHVRYIDLELEIVHPAGKPARIIEKTDAERTEKFFGERLRQKARSLAAQILQQRRERDRSHGIFSTFSL